MVVGYPRKVLNKVTPRQMMAQVVQDRRIHMVFLNSYRYSEQHSCIDLTNLIEILDGHPRELVRDLSHHINDEARHAAWLTDLLYDLGENLETPKTGTYLAEFNRLIDRKEATDFAGSSEDGVIAALAAINATEKRGCQSFSAHITALKEAPASEENGKILATLERILPEEATHVSWGNRWLARLARQSQEMRTKVEQAKRKFTLIEQAAYEAGLDLMAGAELRRLSSLVDIANTLPAWERPGYLLERLPQTLLAPDLQKLRMMAVQRAWQESPQTLFEKFIPAFLKGLRDL
jgi:rubrerythrin